MSLPAVCPGCGADYHLPEQLSDREVHCMDCGEPFIVKGARRGDGFRSSAPRGVGRAALNDEDDLPPPPVRGRRLALPPRTPSLWLPGMLLIFVLVLFGGLAFSTLWLFTAQSPRPAAPMPPMAVAANNLPPLMKVEDAWADPQPAVAPRPDPPIPAPIVEPLPEPRVAPALLPPPKVELPPQKLTDEELKKLLGEVTLPRKVGEAVEALATIAPDDKRIGEVVPLLTAAARATDLNSYVRADAARGLGRWRTPDSLAALCEVVSDSSQPVRHAAIEALASHGTEPAAGAIVRQLGVAQDRGHASSILRGMGMVAERPVIAALADPSWEVRAEACKILGEVGTPQSLPALDGAAGDVNPLVRQAAQSARLRARAR